jgi:hypothetical protein
MKLAKLDSANQLVIRNETVDEEFNKINNAVSKDLAGTDFIAIILGNCSNASSFRLSRLT